MNLWELFNEGGWGMYPTLVLGLVTLIAAARFAWTPEPKRLGFIVGLWVTTIAQILHTTLTDVGAVFSALVHIAEPDDRLRVMFEGFKECTRPGILGGVFLILALLFVSIGLNRTTTRAGA
jgi:hypothetical protein